MTWERLTDNFIEKGALATLVALFMQSELARLSGILLLVIILQAAALAVLHYFFGRPPENPKAYREAAGTAALYLLFVFAAMLMAAVWPEWQPVARTGLYFFLGVEGYELLRMMGTQIKLPALPARREVNRP